jgi:hypothetical protein
MVATTATAIKKPKKLAAAVPTARRVGTSKRSGGRKAGSGYSPQVRALAMAFKKHPSPTAEQLAELSKSVKMSAEALATWFQQRRALEAEWFCGVIMRSADPPREQQAAAPPATVLSATSPSDVRSEPDEPDETRLLATTSDDLHARLGESDHLTEHSPLAEMTLEDVHGAMSFLLEEQEAGATVLISHDDDDDDTASGSAFTDDVFV